MAGIKKAKAAVQQHQRLSDAKLSVIAEISMSNTAEIYKFPAQQGKQESRMAELENGYLRLANQIQDALCIVELSGREFRVLNAIVRLTYGWSKKSDRIANSLIADKTTLKVKHVSEAVLNLAYRNIIIIRRIGQTRYIGINTHLDKWAYAKAVSKELTDQQGVPVLADCKRCGGRGYERIPSTEAYAAVCLITDTISVATWEKSVKRFYDQLITKFDIEEAWAEAQLKQITR